MEDAKVVGFLLILYLFVWVFLRILLGVARSSFLAHTTLGERERAKWIQAHELVCSLVNMFFFSSGIGTLVLAHFGADPYLGFLGGLAGLGVTYWVGLKLRPPSRP